MKKSYIIEGIIFIIFISLLFYFGVKAFNHFFDIGKTYQVTFHDIDGIVIGSPVRIMGVDVGNVTKIKNEFDEIELTFVIYDTQVPVPAGTLATIEFSGLAGSRSIELYPPHSEFKGVKIFQLEEPIRVGDAIDIMGKLGDAMMKSVAGIFEFAKSRPQSQFSSETQALLNSTKSINTAVVTTTDKIVSADNKLHNNFKQAITLGENVNSFAVNLNERTDIYAINSILKFSKRNVVNLSRDVKNFDKTMNTTSFRAMKRTEAMLKNRLLYPDFNQINTHINFLNNSLCTIDKIFCTENINKIKVQTESIKNLTKELDNAL